MITDKRQIAGLQAYLRDLNFASTTNLASFPGSQFVATSPHLVRRQQWRVERLCLYLQADDLAPLLTRQVEPILRLSLIKELFPGYYADPFKLRAASLAGSGDLKAGSTENCKVLEIDGLWTLVSAGADACNWTSAVITYPEPNDIEAICWDLASSRQAAEDAFRYSLSIWVRFEDQSEETRTLISNGNAASLRFVSGLNLNQVIAIQFTFAALIHSDSYIRETYSSAYDTTLGRPLFHGITTFARTDSPFHFYSLSELVDAGFTDPVTHWDNSTLKHFKTALDLNAVLAVSDSSDPDAGNNERVEIEINPQLYSVFEARLQGEELTLAER